MALRAVGIQIGTRAVFEAARRVIEAGERGEVLQVRVVEIGVEQAEVVPRAQFVVGDAGRDT